MKNNKESIEFRKEDTNNSKKAASVLKMKILAQERDK